MLTLIILSSLSSPAPTQILLSLMLRRSVRKNCRVEGKWPPYCYVFKYIAEVV